MPTIYLWSSGIMAACIRQFDGSFVVVFRGFFLFSPSFHSCFVPVVGQPWSMDFLATAYTIINWLLPPTERNPYNLLGKHIFFHNNFRRFFFSSFNIICVCIFLAHFRCCCFFIPIPGTNISRQTYESNFFHGLSSCTRLIRIFFSQTFLNRANFIEIAIFHSLFSISTTTHHPISSSALVRSKPLFSFLPRKHGFSRASVVHVDCMLTKHIAPMEDATKMPWTDDKNEHKYL